MAVLSDENRSITSIPEGTPLHGVIRMPRRGVNVSSLTLPRKEGDAEPTHFFYKGDKDLIKGLNSPKEKFIGNAGLVKRPTPRWEDERQVPAQRDPLPEPKHPSTKDTERTKIPTPIPGRVFRGPVRAESKGEVQGSSCVETKE